jgi:hypothetical protein
MIMMRVRNHPDLLPSLLSVVNSEYPCERWRIDFDDCGGKGLFAAFPERFDGVMGHHFVGVVKPWIAAAGVIGGAFQALEHNAGIGFLLNIQIVIGNVDLSDQPALRRGLIGVGSRRKECAC